MACMRSLAPSPSKAVPVFESARSPRQQQARGQSLGNQKAGACASSTAQTYASDSAAVRATCGRNTAIRGFSEKWSNIGRIASSLFVILQGHQEHKKHGFRSAWYGSEKDKHSVTAELDIGTHTRLAHRPLARSSSKPSRGWVLF